MRLVLAALVERLGALECARRVGLGLALPRIGERDRDVLDRFVAQLERRRIAGRDGVVVELDALVEVADRLDEDVALVVAPRELVDGLGVQLRLGRVVGDLAIGRDAIVELAGNREVLVRDAAHPRVTHELDLGAGIRLTVGVRIAQRLGFDALDRLGLRRHRRRLAVPLVVVRARQREEDLERLPIVFRLGVVREQVQRRRRLPVRRELLEDVLPQRE
jgi:hypothetical protein